MNIHYRFVPKSGQLKFFGLLRVSSVLSLLAAAHFYLPASASVGQPLSFIERVAYECKVQADISVFRPSDRLWYLLQSIDRFFATQFGFSDAWPVAADYDDDDKADAAVFREGVWYLQRSTQGFLAMQFGLANDVPVPSAQTP